MLKSKLIRLFISLSKKECNEFGRYLKTPYFNRNDKLVKLYNYLKIHTSKPNNGKLSKEKTFEKLFSRQKYDSKKIQEVMTDMSLALQNYLVLKESKNNKLDWAYLLLQVFKSKNLNDDYLELLDKMQKGIDLSEHRDMYYFFHKQRLHHCRFNNPKIDRFNKEGECIEDVMHNLDLCYAMAKLKYSCELLLRALLLNQSIQKQDILLLEQVRNLIQERFIAENGLFKIYYLILQFVEEITSKQPKWSTYHTLRETVEQHISLASQEERYSILTYLIDSTGLAAYYDSTFLVECKVWYRFGLEHDMLFEEGNLGHAHFINMVILGSELGEPDWIKKLKEQYLDFIPTEFREVSLSIADAFLFFTQERYKDTIELLEAIRFKNIIYKLQHRALYIRSLYELGEWKEVDRLCDNFRVFLHRSKIKIADEVIHANETFIKMVRQLPKTTQEEQDLDIKSLQQELKEADRVVCRLWLEGKIK